MAEQEMEHVEIENKVEEDIGSSHNEIENEGQSKDVSDTKKDDDEDEKIDGKKINKMREIEIEKIVLHCGGTDDKLEKSRKLLEMITGNKKIFTVKSTRRIPAFGISPGKQSGVKITIRNKEKIEDLLSRFFSSMENEIKKKGISINQFCFGVPEYIEVPGLDYDRDIGIIGFEVMVVFARKGKRAKMKKIQRGSYPKKQEVTPEEIEEYLVSKFDLEVE